MSGRYQHEQAVPSSLWVIGHNLFTRAPIVDCWVTLNGVEEKILPKAVKVISPTECHVEWSVPRAGRAGVI